MLRVECGEGLLFGGDILRVDVAWEEGVRELDFGGWPRVFVDVEHGQV